ncbi:DNA-binding protein [Streptomyces avermitilis]|uniref:DNA-binding protein n=2 Tax=Streptomyces avermitilis TaxID=33903 RepID=Q82DG9_STRAW|nr:MULTISPECIES: helix-turn-helix transcriptional regulator [Streptomyces]KUN52377.1 DNA-binding protein [Streptomyces avermitilis]MYT00596.1 helix-turn-helix domain-containing protein [Streptomyces sp. SID5469]OOV30272.1 transcriptional regulator [Streptomyces avermitilis]BAC72725.1 putative DNA-binding protein [Streptomyces avermitilis MA-4680 = NBRC 14893]BBJ53103.1 transcriptional regulator [Streptomyces avermitilis]
MPPRQTPTARQLRLGVELRKLREGAGLTAREAGEMIGANQAGISNIETGRFGLSEQRIRTLAHNYDCTDEPLIDALVAMAAHRERGWWEEYRDTLPPRFLDVAEMEHHARALRVAQVINIPGLLQTPEHARTLFRQVVPALRPHEIEYRISHRIKRQAVLYREQAPSYTAIVHEAALRMRFGGPEVSRAQLDHIIEVSEQPHITVRVIPFDGTVFPTVGHGLDYASGPVRALDTAQLDAAHGSELIDAPAQLTKYRLILDRMENATLEPDESRDLIHRIAHAA